MNLLEGILIVIIILLTFIVITGKRGEKPGTMSRTWDCVDRGTGDMTSVEMKYSGHAAGCKCPKCASPEKFSQDEQWEYFNGCGDPSEMSKAAGCEADGKFEYALNEYGAPGMSYTDWVASQSVSTDVIKNHVEFVKDQVGKDQNGMGRTYDPAYRKQEIESDFSNWVGLRRPQHLPGGVCNPDQVSDFHENSFSDKPKFTWSSS